MLVLTTSTPSHVPASSKKAVLWLLERFTTEEVIDDLNDRGVILTGTLTWMATMTEKVVVVTGDKVVMRESSQKKRW